VIASPGEGGFTEAKRSPKEVFMKTRLCKEVELAGGEVLCRPGDQADALYLVRSGKVEVSELLEGNGLRGRRVLGPGQFFGELDFVRPRPSPLMVRALERTSLLRIDGEGLQRVLAERRGGRKLRLKGLLGCGDRLVFLC